MHEVDSKGGEMLPVDGGHQDGCELFKTPTGDDSDNQHMKAVARARHETINVRLKVWRALCGRHRHSLTSHAKGFGAVANMTQMALDVEGTAFHVDYSDNAKISLNLWGM